MKRIIMILALICSQYANAGINEDFVDRKKPKKLFIRAGFATVLVFPRDIKKERDAWYLGDVNSYNVVLDKNNPHNLIVTPRFNITKQTNLIVRIQNDYYLLTLVSDQKRAKYLYRFYGISESIEPEKKENGIWQTLK